MTNPSSVERGRIGAALAGRLPESVAAFPDRQPGLYQWLATLCLLAVFLIVEYFFSRSGYLSSAAYAQSSLLLGVLERLGPLLTSAAIVVAATLIVFGRLASPWSSLEHGGQLRWFIVFVAAITTWSLATLGYNYYFDQAYVPERVLLVVLLPLIYFRPLFVFPYLFVAYAMLWQIDQPSLGGGAMLPPKLHVLRVLDLFGAAFLLHAVTGTRSMRAFVFLTCCLVAAVYWLPALTKWQLDWLSYGHLYRMPLAAHAHGWLASQEPATIVEYARRIAPLDLPMQIFVMTAETACVLILWRRQLTLVLLAALSVFHIGVFVLYGYLFWSWILLNFAVAALLLSDKHTAWQIFGGHRVALAALLVLSGSYWAGPSTLGWYDTRLTYTYRYEVTGKSGKHYALPMRFFEPYGEVFTMANFGYLPSTHNMLVFPYGITGDRTIADELNAATTAEQVFTLEEKIGRTRHDPKRATQFYNFIASYLAIYNARGERMKIVEALGPPPLFWSSPKGQAYIGQEPVVEIAVFEVTTLFDETRLAEIRTIELARMAIPDSDSIPPP